MARKRKRKWRAPISTPTYNSWKSMIARTRESTIKAHAFYIAKGIKVCERWLDYDNFYEDMGERPFDTSLDRINGNGNYEPGNCRWASHRVQQNNKDSLTEVERNGVVKTIGEWAFELCISERELSRVYKRHSKYGVTTFDELFCPHLRAHRTQLRINECLECGKTESAKWRKEGRQCNTCYHKAYRKIRRITNENQPREENTNT